ncbi:MAG: hypothetical protein WBN93_00480, partial [Acidimicrobiia bacterium]
MEENLEQLEATYGAPASLFERSAAARARASGSTTEAVVAQWSGEDSPSADSSPSGGGAAEGGGGQASTEPEPSSDAPAAGALSGAALLAAVADARGMPEGLIERS